jgi:hypothetical protein
MNRSSWQRPGRAPACEAANQQKAQQLPSAELVLRSRERILSWWSQAYDALGLFARFRDEALASLPLAASLASPSFEDPTATDVIPILDAIFAGLDNQRVRLRADQQVREWDGPRPQQ